MKVFWVMAVATVLNLGITVVHVLGNMAAYAAINGFMAGASAGLAFAAFIKYRLERE